MKKLLSMLLAILVTSVASSEGAEAPPHAERDSKMESLITASRPGGLLSESKTVALTAKGPGTIRYTLNGSDPTAGSHRYSAPIKLTATALLKARLFGDDGQSSALFCESYTFVDRSLSEFTSNLPLVVLDTFQQEIDNVKRTPVSVCFIGAPEGAPSSLHGAIDFAGAAILRYRGHTSLRYPKRSYSIKLTDGSTNGVKAPLIGLPKDNDWVLYAPYPDKTMMRDALAFEMSNQMGHYAPRTRYVELFINSDGGPIRRAHYMGVYLLVEKIKRGKNRLNIAELKPGQDQEPEVSGGYIFKKDHFDQGEMMDGNVTGTPSMRGGGSSLPPGYPTGPGGFPGDPSGFLTARRSGNTSSSNRRRMTIGPDGRIVTTDQDLTPGRDLTRDLQINPNPIGPPVDQGGFFRDLFFPGGGRPSRGNSGRSETFSTRTGQTFFLVEPEAEEISPGQRRWLQAYVNKFEAALYGPEFRDPVQGYASYIDPLSFIDFHLIVELTKNIDGFRFSTFYSKDRSGKLKMEPIWDWNLAFGNCNGKQGYIPKYWYWPQLTDEQYPYFRRLFEDPDFGQLYVDRYEELRQTVFNPQQLHRRIDDVARLLESAQQRNYRKWPILGLSVWPNYFVGESYEEEVGWMKDWIQKRCDWITQQFILPPTLTVGEPDGQATLTSTVGTIFYTVDGTDPRLPGGEISPAATKYEAAISWPRDSRLFARVQSGSRWSAPTRSAAQKKAN